MVLRICRACLLLMVLMLFQGSVSLVAPPLMTNLAGKSFGSRTRVNTLLYAKKRTGRKSPRSTGDIEELISSESFTFNNFSRVPIRSEGEDEGTVLFPELEQTGIDEKKLRESPFGKVLFGYLVDRVDPGMNSQIGDVIERVVILGLGGAPA